MKRLGELNSGGGNRRKSRVCMDCDVAEELKKSVRKRVFMPEMVSVWGSEMNVQRFVYQKFRTHFGAHVLEKDKLRGVFGTSYDVCSLISILVYRFRAYVYLTRFKFIKKCLCLLAYKLNHFSTSINPLTFTKSFLRLES